jgi:hypothetical protein
VFFLVTSDLSGETYPHHPTLCPNISSWPAQSIHFVLRKLGSLWLCYLKLFAPSRWHQLSWPLYYEHASADCTSEDENKMTVCFICHHRPCVTTQQPRSGSEYLLVYTWVLYKHVDLLLCGYAR